MSAAVRIRIPVVVGTAGAWAASGWCREGQRVGEHDGDGLGVALDMFDGEEPYRVVYVEADVPLPDSPIVSGEVKS
jgi:hypothetical protein